MPNADRERQEALCPSANRQRGTLSSSQSYSRGFDSRWGTFRTSFSVYCSVVRIVLRCMCYTFCGNVCGVLSQIFLGIPALKHTLYYNVTCDCIFPLWKLNKKEACDCGATHLRWTQKSSKSMLVRSVVCDSWGSVFLESLPGNFGERC